MNTIEKGLSLSIFALCLMALCLDCDAAQHGGNRMAIGGRLRRVNEFSWNDNAWITPTTSPLVVDGSGERSPPTLGPSQSPAPTKPPTVSPPASPSFPPSSSPTAAPSSASTSSSPSSSPTGAPSSATTSSSPSSSPTAAPSSASTSSSPSSSPTAAPSSALKGEPIGERTGKPSRAPIVSMGFNQTAGDDPTTVDVPAGGTANDSDGFQPAVLEQKVTGIVFEDTNGNGFQDDGEPGIANVTVVITDSSGDSQNVTTDSEGFYSANVPPGNTTIDIDEESLPGDYISTEAQSEPTIGNTLSPTSSPSQSPGISAAATSSPTISDESSNQPSARTTNLPSSLSSSVSTSLPSLETSNLPSSLPSSLSTSLPSLEPSNLPSSLPSSESWNLPSFLATSEPSSLSKSSPTVQPSELPSYVPTMVPTEAAAASSTTFPTLGPSASIAPTETTTPTIPSASGGLQCQNPEDLNNLVGFCSKVGEEDGDGVCCKRDGSYTCIWCDECDYPQLVNEECCQNPGFRNEDGSSARLSCPEDKPYCCKCGAHVESESYTCAASVDECETCLPRCNTDQPNASTPPPDSETSDGLCAPFCQNACLALVNDQCGCDIRPLVIDTATWEFVQTLCSATGSKGFGSCDDRDFCCVLNDGACEAVRSNQEVMDEGLCPDSIGFAPGDTGP